MNDSGVDELGPVDYLVVEFPAERSDFSDAVAADLCAVVDRGRIRVLDLLFLQRNGRGSVDVFESNDFANREVTQLRKLERDLAAFIHPEDVRSWAQRWRRETSPRCSSGRTRGPLRSAPSSAARVAGC
jgi:hypothetical protein